MLKGQGITKIYTVGNEQQRVLNSVDLVVEKEEFLVIMGPSGSGKSTLLNVLSGIEAINEGAIEFQDKDLTCLSENERAHIRLKHMGFVFQQATFIKNLNLLDNIILPVFDRKDISRQEWVNRGKKLMDSMGIEVLCNHYSHQVSGGQLQRAGICRAIIHDPSIIFADEPTGSLNAQTSEAVMEIFSEIHKWGTTIVMVTHNPRVAALSDRVLFLKDGRIIEEILFHNSDSNQTEVNIARINVKMVELGI